MLQNVKLQNVMLQMNLDVNLIEYPEFSAIGKGEESPLYTTQRRNVMLLRNSQRLIS